MTNEQHLKWINSHIYHFPEDSCDYCGLYGLRWKRLNGKMRLVLISGEPHLCTQYTEETSLITNSQNQPESLQP